MNNSIIELCHITKRYPGVTALNDVSFCIDAGEVHALVGENGAGKSTMIKILAGAIPPSEGSVIIDGKTYDSTHLPSLENNAVSVVYQELNLVSSLTVAENIYLGQEAGALFNKREIFRKAKELLTEIQIDIDEKETVENLTVGKQQMVEIAKAVSKTAKVIVMDEPTASLSSAEVEHLFRIIHTLKQKGITVIYISHRMDEIFDISDRVTVLRDGQYVDTLVTKDVSKDDLIPLMIGRKLSETYPERKPYGEDIVLETVALSGNGDEQISLQLHKGEILGLAGLVGAGRTELAEMLVGVVKPKSGIIRVHEKEVTISSPSKALNLGIGLIPEDRKEKGLFLDFSILWNNEMAVLKSISKGLLIRRKKAYSIAEHYAQRMGVKAPSLNTEVRTLSGGNQQKVVLCKMLACKTDILILDEPTRGIDVGAKKEIYDLMTDLVAAGVSIIMITSDMEELLGMSDRILVMCEGKMTGELTKESFSQDAVLRLASGMI